MSNVESTGTGSGTEGGTASGTPAIGYPRRHLASDGRVIEAYTMQAIRDMMDQAHYSAVRYWADVQVNHDADNHPYLIRLREVIDDWVVPIEYGKDESFTTTGLFYAMNKIVHPAFKVRHEYKEDFAAILAGVDTDWDDEHADILMQTAMFGELVYG